MGRELNNDPTTLRLQTRKRVGMNISPRKLSAETLIFEDETISPSGFGTSLNGRYILPSMSLTTAVLHQRRRTYDQASILLTCETTLRCGESRHLPPPPSQSRLVLNSHNSCRRPRSLRSHTRSIPESVTRMGLFRHANAKVAA